MHLKNKQLFENNSFENNTCLKIFRLKAKWVLKIIYLKKTGFKNNLFEDK
jgi:hypothetical protein